MRSFEKAVLITIGTITNFFQHIQKHNIYTQQNT